MPDDDLKLLIPDLPCADALLPWLRRIDAARQYTNFGPLVQELEQLLAQHWPVPDPAPGLPALQVLTLSSGSSALELAMAALQLPAGGEVLLPAYTFPATAATVLRNGLQPVLADVSADHWTLSPATARAAAARRDLRLVVPVASFGCPLDVPAWDRFVADTGIPVLMDAAAAFGNQAIGQLAHAVFSLHATKPFGIGEGGLFVTRDAALAQRVRQRSNFGFDGGRVRVAAGNAKLSEYAAAVALCQWARWPQRRARRAQLWQHDRRVLAALPGVRLQAGFDAGPALPAGVVLRLPVPAQAAAAALARRGIETRRWYCPPLSAQPAFAACPVFGDPALPVTADLAVHALGLPWHDFLTPRDLDRIGAHVAELLPCAAELPR